MNMEKKCILLGIVFLLLAPLFLPAYGLTTLVRILFYGLLAFSLGFLVRNVGMISLLQTSFFGLAGYMVGIFGVNMGWAFPWPPIMGIIVALASALMFGLIALRTFDISFLMITLAGSQLCWALAHQWISVFGGFNGIQGIRAPEFFTDPNVFYYTLLTFFVFSIGLLRLLVDSPFGLALRGVKESAERMAALGYSVFTLRLVAFVMAAFIASIGGIFNVYFAGVATPSVLSLERTIWVLLIVILGGSNYFWGPLFGTACVVILDVVISQMTERYNSVIGVIFLIIVLFAADKGLFKVLDFIPSRSKRIEDKSL